MIRALSRLLLVPDKLAVAGLVRGMAGQVQLGCASALLRSGVLARLDRPRTLAELTDATSATEPELLRSLLDFGVGRGLLRKRGDQFATRSSLARVLARDPSGPLASMLLEVTSYHQEVMSNLPERLRGEPPRDYLSRYGALVAQSSRILDHWICDWTRRLVMHGGTRRLLDLGCGSGAMLSFIASLDPAIKGVGLELDPATAEAARSHLVDAGCADRFDVRVGDMRDAAAWPDQAFDLVTANQNVYYFDADERTTLWRDAAHRLADGGRLAIVTATAGGPMSAYFDLILGSSEGCRPLPSVGELEAEMAAAGLVVVRRERLIPGDSVFGLAAEVRA